MKLYIAGKMRGCPAYNFPAFYEAEAWLQRHGHGGTFNPARADVLRVWGACRPLSINPIDPQKWGQYLLDHPEKFDLRQALAEDFAYITREADGIVLLPGWEESSGVKAEKAAAEALGLPLYLFVWNDAEDDWELIEYVPDERPENLGSTWQRSVERLQARMREQTAQVAEAMSHLLVNDDREVRGHGVDFVVYDECEPEEGGRVVYPEPITAEAWASEPETCSAPGCDGCPECVEAHKAGDFTGEVRTTSATGGQKGVKPERMGLIPKEFLDALGQVYGYGVKKYAAENWRHRYEFSKSLDALLRHVTAFINGETYDPESGLHHLAHAAFHLAALITWIEQDGEGLDNEMDDRWPYTLQRAQEDR